LQSLLQSVRKILSEKRAELKKFVQKTWPVTHLRKYALNIWQVDVRVPDTKNESRKVSDAIKTQVWNSLCSRHAGQAFSSLI